MPVQVLTPSCSVDRSSADRSSVREWELGLVAEAVLERIGKLCSSVPPSFWPFPPSPKLSRVEPSLSSSNRASPSRVFADISCSFPIWHIDSLPSVVLRWGASTLKVSVGFLVACAFVRVSLVRVSLCPSTVVWAQTA